MIGVDFEKIEYVLFGWDLLEPMALIMDSIMGLLSIYFAIKIAKYKSKHPFYTYWMWFFLLFGLGAFYGGFTHALFNYWGVSGKIPVWLLGPLSVYALEQAMIAASTNKRQISLLKGFSFWKYFIVTVVWLLIYNLYPLEENPAVGFLPVAFNTIFGVLLFAGFLAQSYYKKKLSINYRYFVLAVIIMIPSAFVYLLKINLHPWFDKNDLAHLLLGGGIIYFYLGVSKLHKEGVHQDRYL